MDMNPDNYQSPRIGRRMKLHDYTGTIRYIGNVQGTRDTWLGVEWDDPSRGKHSGEKDGKQYFVCKVPGSGSFIRPSPSISYGQSFLRALMSKYVELPHTFGQRETVILGSSNGTIEVEAVGLDKVRSKLAKLERLREISLDADDVAWADPPGETAKTCPSVYSLDLSNSLLSSWDMVALISAELPVLRTLILNRNRFSTLSDTKNLHTSFSSLEELRADRTLISWAEVITLTTVMPSLRYLELGYNALSSLGAVPPQKISSATRLKVLNLDGNELEEWSDVMISITPFTTLERLILTSNRIRRITPPALRSTTSNIKHIGLQDNYLSTWPDIDALNVWLPGLETLNMNGNPLVSGSNDFRQQAIARLPFLLSLNGTAISIKERNDCEIYYLSLIVRTESTSDEERSREHPRWKELCEKHGAPERSSVVKDRDTLAGRLIRISVYWSGTAEPERPPAPQTLTAQLPPPLTLRVLPTMTVRSFRLKLLKALKLSSASFRQETRLAVWLLMNDNNLTELDLDQETRDLAWWGIQDGSQFIVRTEQSCNAD
ncbi:hypothetical protein M0805_002130 [Coniferiporia weirii]|nr:hypothetical protein M0805_002130 [Coniferiporia weirii]